MKTVLLFAGALVCVCGHPPPARAQFDDFVLGYDAMFIPSARVGGNLSRTEFLRQALRAELGMGEFGFGFQLQDARDLGEAEGVQDELGAMLTVRYSPLLTDFLRLETFGRAGLTHHASDPAQQLFATDTDLALSLVAFDVNGIGSTEDALFLSGHFGGVANWVGRVQLVGGIGGWWRQLGFYVTGFWSLNGNEDFSGTDQAAWARVNDAGVSLALSWDLDFGDDETVRVELRQNLPIRNGGFDTSIGLQWNLPLLEDEPEETLAW